MEIMEGMWRGGSERDGVGISDLFTESNIITDVSGVLLSG